MNDVITNKAAQIQRCLVRIHEEYDPDPTALQTSYTIQDAIIFNIQRACELSIDIATYIVKEKKLGIPESSRQAFELLGKANIIPDTLCDSLIKMVGFRNIAIHNDDDINMAIVESVILHKLQDIEALAELAARQA